MNDDLLSGAGPESPAEAREGEQTLGSSSIFKLFYEMIALREMNDRQHKFFEQTLAKTRDDLKSSFNSFAADTQRAYQQLRQEVHGEKRVSLALLNELLEVGMDLDAIVAARPSPDDREAVAKWMESVEVQSRKVQAALARHGVLPYDAVISSPYNPAIHERVGSTHAEGLSPLLIAAQRERGWASQQPEFVLRRPKVIVSE
jgi:molecular chaperone GrpE (heat shock protein)